MVKRSSSTEPLSIVPNNGLYVSNREINGNYVFFDQAGTKPVPTIMINGYPAIDNQYLNKKNSKVAGQWVHAMVVFSHLDCNYKKYNKEVREFEIDHIDMDHMNANVWNLQIVSKAVNLWRAYYKMLLLNKQCDAYEACKKRFREYMDKLDAEQIIIAWAEINADMAGNLL